MKEFDEPGSLAPVGLHLGGVKYLMIQGDPGEVIRGKKVRTLIAADFKFEENESEMLSPISMFYLSK